MNKNELKNIVLELESFNQEKIKKLQALRNIIETNITEEISLDLFSKMIYIQAMEDIQISHNLLNILGVNPKEESEKPSIETPKSDEVEIKTLERTKQEIKEEEDREHLKYDIEHKKETIKNELEEYEQNKKGQKKDIAMDLMSKINNLRK